MILLCSVTHSALATTRELSPNQDGENIQIASKNSTKQVSPDLAMQELLDVLDEETEIATHTKMNIDFVPGIVSVLHGKDLRARGVRTVLDALTYVPGIEVTTDNVGQVFVIVRGVGRVRVSSKIKILLDGTAFNATLHAVALPLSLPIELVDRIEMIRGPGSAIYGEFASLGVLNIITRKSSGHAFTQVSDQSRTIIGGQYQWGSRETGINVSFSQDTNDGGRVTAGNDVLQNSPFPSYNDLSNSPGPINDAARRTYIALSGDINRYHIQWQRLENEGGDFFGASNALPRNSDQLLSGMLTQNISIEKKITVNHSINANYQVGWMQSVIDSQQYELFPPGFDVPPGSGVNEFPQGVLGGPHYEENKYYLKAESNIRTESNHDLLLGLELSTLTQGETYAYRNYQYRGVRIVPVENAKYTGADNWLREGLSRDLHALYFQDQYPLTEKLQLTTGIRYDHYSDIGGDVTPRIASVYQLDPHKTFKLQFAQSFRPPTFVELYSQNNAVVNGNPDLQSERLNSFEFGYFYNDEINVAHANLYYYTLTDFIINDPATSTYVNNEKVTASGIEIQYQREVNRVLDFDFIVSLIEAHNKDGSEVPYTASYLWSAELFYTPLPDVSLATRIRSESERQRESGDSRPVLNGYNVVNMTLAIDELMLRGLNLTLSVYNLFDTEIRHPASLRSFGPLTKVVTYDKDYPQLGREISMSLQYEFH
ncbi:MAG: TonB-dependent receptor plug domain-containing protein [Thiohalomonadales bacterium]